MDLYEQYDRIYCYYKLRRRELAEDVTQETFLRFYHTYGEREQALHLLYAIAKNLRADQFRKRREEPLETAEGSGLPENDRELVPLRYVNEVPLSALSRLYGVSRFTLYRHCGRILAGPALGLAPSPAPNGDR